MFKCGAHTSPLTFFSKRNKRNLKTKSKENKMKEKNICVSYSKPTATGFSGAVAFAVLRENFKCTSKASLFEDGKWFCKRHAPSKIKEREEKSWVTYCNKLNLSRSVQK